MTATKLLTDRWTNTQSIVKHHFFLIKWYCHCSVSVVIHFFFHTWIGFGLCGAMWVYSHFRCCSQVRVKEEGWCRYCHCSVSVVIHFFFSHVNRVRFLRCNVGLFTFPVIFLRISFTFLNGVRTPGLVDFCCKLILTIRLKLFSLVDEGMERRFQGICLFNFFSHLNSEIWIDGLWRDSLKWLLFLLRSFVKNTV